MSPKKYAFITGCSRSGTTIMADILRAHPRIAMGRERYAGRYYYQRRIPPALFEKERFCRQWHTDDSHHRKLQPYYETLYPRFDNCLVVGDKIPEMALDYEPLLKDYSSPRVVYMLRDLMEVASSFKGRARRAQANSNLYGWPPERGPSAAVAEWNQSNRSTIGALHRIEIAVVWYEDLVRDPAIGDRLCAFLGLENDRSFTDRLKAAQQEGEALKAERRSLLSEQERSEVVAAADMASFQRLRDLA